MARKTWNMLEPRRWILVTLATALVAIAIRADVAKNEDAVSIATIRTYPALDIETGEEVGLFLHILANVLLSDSTRAKIDAARDLPNYLVPRLEISGKQLLPCGDGGRLPQMWPPVRSQEAGEPISPLFFVPDVVHDDLDLVMILERGAGAVARASVPWRQAVVSAVARAEVVGSEVDKLPEDRSQSMQTARLRLPTGLARVLQGGNGDIRCGNSISKGASPDIFADIVITQFLPPVDTSNCQWSIGFPGLGVILELEVSKPQSELNAQ